MVIPELLVIQASPDSQDFLVYPVSLVYLDSLDILV